jgi:hypothetical protein
VEQHEVTPEWLVVWITKLDAGQHSELVRSIMRCN